MAAPQKKTPTKKMTGNLPAQKRKKGGTKRLKKKSVMPQVIGGVTVLGLVAITAVTATYLAQKALPEEPKASARVVARPSITPTLTGYEPRRPGIAVAAEDQVYYTQASDVAGSPLEPSIQGLLGREVITVFADGKFRPAEPIPRAEFANWCYNAMMAQTSRGADPFVVLKKPLKTVVSTGQEFADVPAEHWAASVLASLKGGGFVPGPDAKRFRPDEPLTRIEWLAMASHVAGGNALKEQIRAPLDDKALGLAYRMLHYTDYSAIQLGHKPYVRFVFADDKRQAWVTDTFTPPVNPGPWQPNKPVTRGEAAGWIGSFYESIGQAGF